MTTFDIGRKAEAAAAHFLMQKGCEVIGQNWRTRWCEEVKYRRHTRQGSGLDYITQRKLRQMRFAAELWVHRHRWLGEYQLCALEVSGPDFRITGAVKDL